MTFYLHIDDGRIVEIKFTTDGCDATIACGEMLASLVTTRPLEEAQHVTANDLLAALEGIPAHHTHCAALAVITLREAIASFNGDDKLIMR